MNSIFEGIFRIINDLFIEPLKKKRADNAEKRNEVYKKVLTVICETENRETMIQRLEPFKGEVKAIGSKEVKKYFQSITNPDNTSNNPPKYLSTLTEILRKELGIKQ